MGLVAPRHVGSSWTRARTRVPCIGRRILNHCATREVPLPMISLVAHLENCASLQSYIKFTFIFYFNGNGLVKHKSVGIKHQNNSSFPYCYEMLPLSYTKFYMSVCLFLFLDLLCIYSDWIFTFVPLPYCFNGVFKI